MCLGDRFAGREKAVVPDSDHAQKDEEGGGRVRGLPLEEGTADRRNQEEAPHVLTHTQQSNTDYLYMQSITFHNQNISNEPVTCGYINMNDPKPESGLVLTHVNRLFQMFHTSEFWLHVHVVSKWDNLFIHVSLCMFVPDSRR